MASPKSNMSMSTFESDNKSKSEDMESHSSFVPTPDAKSEDESSNDGQHKIVDENNKSKESELKTEQATTPIATPSASSAPAFDFVKAAEDLLADAKKLKATLERKPSGPDSKPSDASSHAPPMPSPEEMMLRQRIAKLGKKIAFETGPPMAVLMSEMAAVSVPSLSTPKHCSVSN